MTDQIEELIQEIQVEQREREIEDEVNRILGPPLSIWGALYFMITWPFEWAWSKLRRDHG